MAYSGLTKKEESFWDLPINKQARDKFFELIAKCNFSYTIENNKIIVYNIKGEQIGSFVVVGVNYKDKLLKIPCEEINSIEGNQYVATVIFNEENVENILLFKCSELVLGKPHKFFKNSPKLNMFGIKTKKYKSRSFQKQKFGVILNKYINIGEK